MTRNWALSGASVLELNSPNQTLQRLPKLCGGHLLLYGLLEWLDSRQPGKSAMLRQTRTLSPVANATSAISVRVGSLNTSVAKCGTSFLRLNLCDRLAVGLVWAVVLNSF
jgi:hypothetical protein